MTYTAHTGSNTCLPSRRRFSLLSFVANRTALMRQRRALKALDGRALEDIGISRFEAHHEANRPIWDAPASWRR